jgi:hypothetical protein
MGVTVGVGGSVGIAVVGIAVVGVAVGDGGVGTAQDAAVNKSNRIGITRMHIVSFLFPHSFTDAK